MTETQTYDRELGVALELAREAGAAILEIYEGPLDIQQKLGAGDREPVTQADTLANEIIVTRLQQEFPLDGILAEESIDTAHRLDKARVWMIDPLDGTTGFIAGNGDFAVQIGLTENGACVLGVVYQPVRDLLYYAAKGSGAWIEGANRQAERMTVSAKVDPREMILASSRSHRSPRMERVVNLFGFKQEVRRGSVGVKVGLITEQQADLYLHLSPSTKQWDTCAPEMILHEAGGRLTDLFGDPLRYNGVRIDNRNGIVATNGAAHEMVIEKLQPLLLEFGRTQV